MWDKSINRRQALAFMAGLTGASLFVGCSDSRRDKLLTDVTLSGKDLHGIEHEFKIPGRACLEYRDRSVPRGRNGRERTYRQNLIETFFTPEDPLIRDIANRLTRGATSIEQKAKHLFEWVSSTLTYRTDVDSRGREYYRFPVETLYDRFVDCEDSTFAYVSLAAAAGLKVGVIHYLDKDIGNHFAAAVRGKFGGRAYHMNNNPAERYYVVETTASRNVFVGREASDYHRGGVKGELFLLGEK